MKFVDFIESLNDRPMAKILYSYLGKKYADWIGVEFSELGKEHFDDTYVRTYLDTIRNPYTANAFISMCRSFAKYVRFSTPLRGVEEIIEADRFYSSMKLIRFREIPFYVKSSAITIDKLKELIIRAKPPLDSAIIVHFFFGARSTELARKYVKGSINFDKYEACVVDFRKKLIAIPCAKRRGVSRVLPFDGIEEHVKNWINLTEEVVKYYRPRAWFTERMKYLSRAVNLYVTAKTARKTFETEMTKRGVEEWELRYWLGHKAEISDIYRDFSLLIDKLREDIVERHYIFEILQ